MFFAISTVGATVQGLGVEASFTVLVVITLHLCFGQTKEV
jgi:hypothetical protein